MTRVALKNAAARPLRTILSAFAIVLGVAMITAALTVTDTLSKAADSLTASSYDGTDAVVVPRTRFSVGSDAVAATPTLKPGVLQRVRALPEVGAAAGDVTDLQTRLVGRDGKVVGGGPYFGVGLDPKATSTPGLTPFELRDGRFASGPGEVVVDAQTARKQDWEIGDRVRVLVPGGARAFHISGITGFGEVDGLGGGTMTLFELGTAERLLRAQGGADAILVKAAPGVSQARLRAALSRAIPPSARVRTAADQDRFTLKELKAVVHWVRVGLLAFGAVAVLVGAFTIFNTLSITIAQRSRELALARALGSSKAHVMRSVLAEAVVLGALASVVGVLAGYWLGKGLAAVMAATGLDLPSTATVFGMRTVVVGLAVGVGVTALAGVVPARRATRVSPVEGMREGVTAPTRPGVLARGVRLLASVIGRPLAKIGGSAGTLARANAMRNPGRTAATAAALTVGLSLVVAVSVVAQGLKASTSETLRDQIAADYVVGPTDGYSPIDPAAARAVDGVPGVEWTTSVAQDRAEAFGAKVDVNGVDPARIGRAIDYDWVHGDDGALRSLDRPSAPTGGAPSGGVPPGGVPLGGVPSGRVPPGAIVESGFAEKHGLGVGDRFTLTTRTGERLVVTVSGVFEPAALDAFSLGEVAIGKAAFARTFPGAPDRLTFVGAKPGTDASQLERPLARFPDVEAFTPAAFADNQVAWVSQVLAMLYVLLALSILVSLLGIVNTLALSVIERERELGVLRCIGMSGRQVRRMIRHESVITALIGATLGTGVGLAIAGVVTALLSRYGLRYAVPVPTLAVFAVLAALAGVAAAALPARRAARLDPLGALHYE